MIQRQDIWTEQWDYLIILDACRYDFFEKIYKKHFKEGKLIKVQSFDKNASRTLTIDWLCENFKKLRDDIVFISSNPIVNSKGKWSDSTGKSFSGKNVFYKVIDVWDKDWDWKYGTVFPDKVARALLEAKKNNKGKKRFVLDFMQPHFPYIGKGYRKYFLKKDEAEEKSKSILERGKKKKMHNLIKLKILFGKRIRSPVAEFIKARLGDEFLWKIMKIFRIHPKSSWTMIGIKEGIKGIRKAYEENLEFVLSHVSKLISKLDGKIIITADHGEYLGENKKFGHGKNPPHGPEVLEVPWLVIDKKKG